jgi:RNA polymerase primary sigma factor
LNRGRPKKGSVAAAGGEGGGYVCDEASLNLYLKQISKYKPLKKMEEAEMAGRIRKGDRRALRRMVEGNLRFVVSVAMNYRYQGMSVPDLINEGNLGLMRAARRFDEGKGFKFISYAVWWIRQAMLSMMADQSRIVKTPINRVGEIYKIGKATMKLEQKLQRKPDFGEVAKALRMDRQEVVDTMMIGDSHVSFDAPFEDGGTRLEHLQDTSNELPDSCVADISLRQKIEGILGTLTKREARVIKLYFGIDCDTGHTLEDIGQVFNLTRERVRQIKEKALMRLKHSTRSKQLRGLAE